MEPYEQTPRGARKPETGSAVVLPEPGPQNEERWQEPGYRQKVRIKGRAAALFVKLFGHSVRLEHFGRENDRKAGSGGRPVIYVFWHGSQLIPLGVYRGRGIWILTSLSRDGDIQTQVMSCLGYRTIRGSSSRGGARALMGLLRGLREPGARAAIAVDGPRGPYRVAKPGAVLLAQKSAAAVLPVGIAYSRVRRLKNWDQFEIPFPWSRVALVVGEPFQIGPDLSPEEGERLIGERITACNDSASGRLVS